MYFALAPLDLSLQNKHVMRKLVFLLCIASGIAASAQQLTVEKIMRDAKWIGTSPSNISWSWDSKSVFFNWNPDKNVSDSFYMYSLNSKEPVKLKYNEAQLLSAINNGTYNSSYSQIVYAYKGDLYLLDIKSAKTTRITQTEEQESNPKFIMKDEWISFSRNQNLYAWNSKTGFTQQLTNFAKGAETAAVPTFAGGGGNRPGGAGNRPGSGGGRPGGAGARTGSGPGGGGSRPAGGPKR